MFVSSYNTYINPNTIDKNSKVDAKLPANKNSFKSSLQEISDVKLANISALPINYIKTTQILKNRQKLDDNSPSKELKSAKSISALNSSKIAYDDNSKMFSLIKKPQIPLAQTAANNLTLKQSIVNSYIADDRYHKITS